jgi:hypothetical protein
MPEIKNLFTSGKMNKDLDERIIPNNQYRDALNIQVSNSEGADVGAIENILGNTARFNSAYNPDTGVYTQWNLNAGETNYYGFTNAQTIGVVRYDKEEKIYWFVTADNQDGILEYDQTTDVVSPIIIDKNNVLNFSSSNLITGVNIIDGLLFFTDDLNEPKCVNISRFKEATAASGNTSHTEIYGRDFLEEDITVAKKSPITAPELEMYSTKQLGPDGSAAVVETTTYKDFTQLVDGEEVGLSAGTQLTLNWSSAPYPYYNIGDTLVLTAESSDVDIDEYLVRVKVKSVPAGNTQAYAVVTILSVSEAPSNAIAWDVTLEQDPPIFEFKFPRFAYRYIYNNNEVSCFSPFSEVAFLPEDFEYNPLKGFNLGMRNTLRNLKIKSFANTGTVPSNVDKIDILYKDSGNQNVYVVDTIEKDANGNFANQYTIKSEIISKVVESNQILRPWDNVPRAAKSQEIIANRLVYGDYLQNFNIKNAGGEDLTPKVSINIEHDTNLEGEYPGDPGKSIKTLRTYQAGVVYKDKYGRETPVFSSETSAVNLPKTQADKNNKIKLTLESDPPEGFTHFKFFIKENSNEYYNLAMDRFYVESNDNVWLSFPSSERNKVQEDTFIILKKGHDDTELVEEEARYKIIAIENEAPITLKQQNISKGRLETNFDANGFPQDGVISVDIPETDWNNAGFDTNDVISLSDLVCKFFTSSQATTVFYEIANISFFTNKYRITLTKSLEDMSFTGSDTSPASGLGIEIFQKQIKNKPEFQGRFFVKIYNDEVLKEKILSTRSLDDYAIKSVRQLGNTTRNGEDSSNWKSLAQGWYIDNTGSSKRRTRRRKGGLTGTPAGETIAIGAKAGRGTRVGSKYIDVSFFKWGNREYHAWEGYWWGFETSHEPGEADIVKMLESPGQKIRFTDDPNATVYEIKDFARTHLITYRGSKSGKFSTSRLIRWTLKLDQPVVWAPEDSLSLSESVKTGLEFLTILNEEAETFTSTNPAIWETEPKENVDINIFYEASDNIPIAQHGSEASPSEHELDWFNCYSFGNGVESDRIRDDFNAIRMGKGVKVSATLDEPYQEERRENGLIFSQIFNSTSGVNRLNQFIQALPITKDLNPAYGSIQKLHARDTDLIALCEDKVLKILAQKDALFNADGNTNVTSNTNVLGQSIPFVGEYGISKNPESFASYGFRAFFADKNRGVVLRLSRNGLDEISGQGMSDYFSDKLASATTVIGNYDDNSNCYNVTFSDETVSYKQGLEGWPTRKSFVPEAGISLNNKYYTFKDGVMWSHDNQTRNNFYGVQYKSSVKFIFNADPSSIKNFKALSYEGDSGWVTPTIETDQQSGKVLSYIPKEGIYYNFVKGVENTWDEDSQSGSLDTSEFSTQGIDILGSATGDTETTSFTLTIEENND